MIFLDDHRRAMNTRTKHFKKYYKILENHDWYCGKCDKDIEGINDELIYLGEYDVVGHVHDYEKGSIFPVYQRVSKGIIKVHPCMFMDDIPQLQKLIKNINISSDAQIDKIKDRDGNQCQLCGFDDRRGLVVHHIIPRRSPFVIKSTIRNPINCITICANCHRIAHYIMEHGDNEMIKRMNQFMMVLNGWRGRYVESGLMHFESMKKIREYNKMKKI